jgi:DNA-binding MarR family transcriptional regulator
MSSEPRHTSVPKAVPERRAPIHGLLAMAAQQATDEFFGRLHGKGFDTVRPAHGCVFGHIEPEGSRLTDLAARAGYTKQTVGEVTSELEELGYVERVPDPEDKRAKLIRLTERGQEAQKVGRRLIVDVEAEWSRRYGKERVAQLRELLEEIVGQIGVEDLAA